MTWKTTLYDYVHHRNRMDIENAVEPMLPFVNDESYLAAQQSRLARRCDSDKERGLLPVKSETRLSIRQTAPYQNGLAADCILRRVTVGQIRSDAYEEQRVEHERIFLVPASDGEEWIIRRIEPIQGEQRLRLKQTAPGALLEAEDEFEGAGLMRAPSVPLLSPGVLPYAGGAVRRPYNREEAVRYANRWWDGSNPVYIAFEVDCTSYISQCLFAGGAPMNYTDKRDSGWWYKGRLGGQELWSFSWSVAESLQFHLRTSRSGLRGQEVSSAAELVPGDVIAYDWDGDGRFQHSTIVTAKDANGMPLVNAHTVSSKHRYWDYTDSHAWTARTQYRFIHISDSL
ncbi:MULTISPECIES: amidase domain-containing protein [Paenibacillus]|uniref:amidase domain-containing protein n=1 Tax=Paenibacillus TaxID=44249 RepID=UPI0022B8789E|nr:amidase domain-containing protein [Paenibacillus caseinilyticus]MCZ8523858.1 amidase domain-containing protein [Paenibacillus caseinilyticus]